MAKTKKNARAKPFWERGFKSHGYWLGKKRIGQVEVETGKHFEMKYRWRVGNHGGQTTTLREAKRLVEQAVLMGGRQLALFPEIEQSDDSRAQHAH
jgi:hypothetical protein